MEIGIITYSVPHAKTERVVEAFVRRNYDISIFALPFVQRPSRNVQFSHRPDQAVSIHPKELARKHGLKYKDCNSDLDIDSGCDFYHVLIGKLISAECIAGKKIINCHPGIIPITRGLDALKWAVFHGWPVGNTLHFIDAEVDAGDIISIVPTSVYEDDTLESLATRHYQAEIDMTCDFARYLDSPVNPYENASENPSNMRMPADTEKEMLQKFPEFVRRFAGPASG